MKIHILATTLRTNVLDKSINFWKSLGWEIKIQYNDGFHPSVGRNKILEKFYQSDDTWLVMADDDTILDVNKGKTKEFLKDPLGLLSMLPSYVPIIVPMNPTSLMVAATHKQPIYETHWRFERENSVTGKIVFFRKNQHRIYQRTDLEAWEDVEWGYQFIRLGYQPMRLNNIVLKESGKSSLFTDNKHRNSSYMKSKIKICGLYPEIYIDKNGQFIRKNLVKKYIPHHPRFIDIPYEHIPDKNNFKELFVEDATE